MIRKINFSAMFLFMIFTLTGCFAKGNHVLNNLSNSSEVEVKSKPNDVQSVTIKPTQKELEPIKETPKISENFKKDEPVKSPKAEITEINGFVLLSSLDKDLMLDLKYATSDNFTKKIIYPNKICVLRKNTANKLVKANAQLKKSGYRIKVWDAYRPVYVQKIFWDIVKDSRFVANPKNGGSIHNKGCAVDVTLVDVNGNKLKMPSKFDDFSTNAYRSNSKMSNEAKKNMDLLTKCMVTNGFTTIDTEWWHFVDSDSKNYNIANINLKLFLNQK